MNSYAEARQSRLQIVALLASYVSMETAGMAVKTTPISPTDTWVFERLRLRKLGEDGGGIF